MFSHGRTWWHPLVSIRVLQNQSGITHIGFTVSKKIGKAVVRNRVRRRFREIVRQLDLRTNVDIVISARPPIMESSFQDTREAILSVFDRARLFAKKAG